MMSDTISIESNSLDQTHLIGEKIGRRLTSAFILALTGDLGCGKTAFVQGLGRGLDIPDKYYITSPTYTLVNEYIGRLRLFHIDLYRIGTLEDLESIGFFDIISGNGIIAIEWADRLEEGLLDNYLALDFKAINEDRRGITISAVGDQAIYWLKEYGVTSKENKWV
jgi:tRNA threonylcarbamoyladenosine biosynthesis protein TsaE